MTTLLVIKRMNNDLIIFFGVLHLNDIINTAIVGVGRASLSISNGPNEGEEQLLQMHIKSPPPVSGLQNYDHDNYNNSGRAFSANPSRTKLLIHYATTTSIVGGNIMKRNKLFVKFSVLFVADKNNNDNKYYIKIRRNINI